MLNSEQCNIIENLLELIDNGIKINNRYLLIQLRELTKRDNYAWALRKRIESLIDKEEF